MKTARLRSALAAAVLAGSVPAGDLVGQDPCAAVGSGLAPQCMLLTRAAEAGLGRAMLSGAGGNPWIGSPSTLGRRTDTMPRIGLQLRALATRADLPDPSGDDALSGRTIPALSGSIAVGLFDGFAPGTTVGGLLSVDVLGDIGTVVLPDGFDGSALTWGLGARIGIFRESFNLPGITTSVQYRRLGEATYQIGSAGPLGFEWSDASAWNLRVVGGKRVATIGLSGGFAWDRTRADLRIRTRGPAGPGIDTRHDLEFDRQAAFVGVAWTRLIWTLSAEAGLAFGGGEARQSLPDDPVTGSHPFGAISARITF